MNFAKRFAATRAVLISDSSKRRANQILAQAVRDGLTIDKQAEKLKSVYSQDAEYRSMRMARTEVVSASNFGSLAAMKQTGFNNMVKMWVSSRDDRVRSSHEMVDGETVAINDVFSNGLEYPGDIEGDAEEVIHCRCTMAYDFAQGVSVQ